LRDCLGHLLKKSEFSLLELEIAGL
jgi:hypothetical protein